MFGELLVEGGDGFAGAAPGCPEVGDDYAGGLEDLGEVLGGGYVDCFGHGGGDGRVVVVVVWDGRPLEKSMVKEWCCLDSVDV